MPLVLKKRTAITPNQEIQNIDVVGITPRYTEFIKAWYTNCDQKNMFGFIRGWYEKLFKVFPPEQPLPLLRTRIEYELLMNDWREYVKGDSNRKIPETILKNYEASKNFKLQNLNGMVGQYVRAEIARGEDMKKATKQVKQVVKKEAVAKAKETKKMTVTQAYEMQFKANATQKVSDELLAKNMCSLFPEKKKYTTADIRAVRGMYNRGALSTQNGVAPTSKSVSYDIAKAVVGKPQVIVKKKIVIKKK